MKPKATSFLPASILFIITFVLLVLPGSDIPKASIFDAIYFDKWVHIGMFGLLTVAWCHPFLKSGAGSKKIFWVVALAAIAYGIAMEFVQKYFAYQRSFDLFDMVADSVGSIVGFYLMTLWLKKWKQGSI